MKVLLISASPRRNGNTFTALSEVQKTLEKDGIETELIQIGAKPIRGCIACGWCKKHLDEHRCVFDDDITNTIAVKAKDADAFVFGAPVYFGLPNGSAIALIQRLLCSNKSWFEYKPVANVAVCRRGGATMSLQALNEPFEMCNMPIVTSQYWNIVYGFDKGQSHTDVEGLQTMRTIGHNMSWMLKKFNGVETGNRPEVELPKTAMNFIR